jgi:predicted amidophosphoribosyltransferase
VRDTKPQKELSALERENNLKNAFQVADFVVKYNCVLIVDDIYTTGCTAETIAGELQRAGIERIYVLSACIATG